MGFNDCQISFFEMYLNHVKNKNKSLEDESLNKMIENLKTLTSKIIKKRHEVDGDVSFLLAGNVQSGKTNSFIATINKFFDIDSNLAIVYCGVHGEIYEQNVERLSDFFEVQNNYTVGRHIEFVNFSKTNLSEKDFIDLIQKKKIVISVMKNHKRLENLYHLLKVLKDYVNLPLIIDDEGDQYSFNNIIKLKKENDDSATYKNIKKVLSVFENKNYTFLTVTATPYAHVFAPKEYVNGSNVIKPDYGFVIEPGIEYMGFNEFFENPDLLKEITEKDDELDELVRGQTVTHSLKKALCYFFVYGYIYYRIHTKGMSVSEMLVHLSVKNQDNYSIEETINNYLKTNFKSNYCDKNSDEYKFIQEALNEINKKNNNNDDYTIEDFLDRVKKEDLINQFKTHSIVQNKKYNQDIKGKKIYNIIIGSKKIDRGNTFNHLLISFVAKRAKNEASADTLIQMCRWFGYRKKYVDLIRVWLTDTLTHDYISLCETNNQFLEKIKEFEKENISLKFAERALFIRQHNINKTKLQGVRNTVAYQLIIKNPYFMYSSSFEDNKKYWEINDATESMWNILVSYLKVNRHKIFDLQNISKKIGNYVSVEISSLEEFNEIYPNSHLFLQSLKQLYLEDESEEPIQIKAKFLFDQIISYLKENKKIIISLMSKNQDDTIDNLEVRQRRYFATQHKFYTIERGTTKDDLGDKYLGDKYWYKASDEYIFIQLHKIQTIDHKWSFKSYGKNDDFIYKILITSNNKLFKYQHNIVAVDN